ncbi:MAG: putative PurR-regulated permease PerM [Planctomycetota bacterium]|jgi:predicted PurR-regulated permease PerM
MPRAPLPKEIRISTKTILWGMFLVAVAYGLTQIWDFVLVILSAVVIAAFVESMAKPLIRIRIPRAPAIVLVYVSVLVLFGGSIYLIIPTFIGELSGLGNILPPESSLHNIISFFGDFANAKQALGGIDNSAELFGTAREIITSLSGGLIQSLASAFGGVINFVLIAVISLYLAMQHRGIDKFLQAVTPIDHEVYVISIWHRTERKIGLWFRGQVFSALILSILTYLGLLLLGVPYALVLSLVVGIFGLIPFGILVATLPALVIAFITGGAQMLILVALLYLILQQIEEYVIHPLILNKVTGVPSLIILLSLIIGAKLAGFLGIFLGLPTAIMAMELVNDYEEKKRASMTKAQREEYTKATPPASR